jgi:hypothetical protein
MILVLFRAVERAELAVNVADVGVIDVAIDNVGHDFAPVLVVAVSLREIAPGIGQRAQFGERPAINLECFRGRNACAGEDFFLQRFRIERHHRSAI